MAQVRVSSPIIISIYSSELPRKWAQNRQSLHFNTNLLKLYQMTHQMNVLLSNALERGKERNRGGENERAKNWEIKINSVTFGGTRKRIFGKVFAFGRRSSERKIWQNGLLLLNFFFGSFCSLLLIHSHSYAIDVRKLAIHWNFISSFIYFYTPYKQ